ncbi:MAG: hypothetical protein F6K52_16310 [Moorea sp. SIO3H5]|nr:hypothetical protein [Moorena sp. SIO3H5]
MYNLHRLRQIVCPHWQQRGISYLKIGLRWLKGVLNFGRQLLTPVFKLPRDPPPSFASLKADPHYYDRIWFTRIPSKHCTP